MATKTISVRVTAEGVIIPRSLLSGVDEVEVVYAADNFIIRPKAQSGRPAARPPRYPFIGVGQTRRPTASADVETILELEVQPPGGWNLER
ncbi:MAG: hypothetical protein AB1791_07260 [Chloroflexota bacterium]